MITKWLEALRSGNYQQGMGQLRLDDKFCCLGVLCDILDPEGWTEDYYHRNHQRMPGSAILDQITLPMFWTELSTMNDRGSTFEEIADYVEKGIK